MSHVTPVLGITLILIAAVGAFLLGLSVGPLVAAGIRPIWLIVITIVLLIPVMVLGVIVAFYSR